MTPNDITQNPTSIPPNKEYTLGEVQILLEIAELKLEVKQLKEAKYVRREEFEPIQKLVYGMVTVILVAFLGAVVALVITR